MSTEPASPDMPLATPPAFEAALSELEQVITHLEKGDLPLQEAVTLFQKGVRLSQACEQALAQATQVVQMATGSVVTPTAEATDRGDHLVG